METVISPLIKLVVDSLDVNVKDTGVVEEVEPLVIPVIVIVGPILSKVQLNWAAAVLLLLAASVNLFEATSIVQAPLLEGVNVAVYTVEELTV